MKSRNIILAIALAAAAFPMSAKQPSNVLDLKESITDDAIIFPESFEADAQKMLESWYIKNYTDTDDRYRTSTNPSTSDATIKERLADLPTVIDMPFNQIVRSYIDRYVEKGRPMVASLLGLSTYYMPIFEQALEAEQLPQELKYLPVIESALNPNAVSRSGAGGLWQFMPAAAKGYDLEISSLVDERRDPYKSSQKAAKLLHDLYDTYGDWSLAIAAYNCGPGNVNKAIRRAGGDPKQQDFWSIYKYLSPETRGYVPMFIAANYVMNYYKEHNISPVLPTRPLVTDTVGVSSRVHFDQISAILDIPKEELRILNPQFRADIIPGSSKHQYMLILPSRQAQAYIMSEPEILAYEASKYARRTEANPGEVYAEEILNNEDSPLLASDPINSADDEVAEEDEENATPPARQNSDLNARTRTVTHTVRSNETINDIADKYKVRVADIRSWNSLRRNAVREGQELRIETTLTDNEIQAINKKAKPATSNNNVAATTTPTPAKQTTPAKQAASAKQVTAANNAPAKQTTSTANNTKKQAQAQTQTAANNTSKKQQKQNETAANTKTGKNGKQNETAANTKNGKNNKQNETAANTKNTKNGKNGKNDKTAANDKNEKAGKNGKNNKQAETTAANTKNGKNGKNGKQEATATTSKGGTHDIQSGESLTTIARKHGVTVEDLKKANNLKDDKIIAGESLKVPKASKNANAKGNTNNANNAKDTKANNSKANTKANNNSKQTKKKK